MENYDIVDQMWWTGATGTVGAILTHNPENDTHAAFIGVAEGVNERLDSYLIKDWGAKLEKCVAESIFGPIERYRFGD